MKVLSPSELRALASNAPVPPDRKYNPHRARQQHRWLERLYALGLESLDREHDQQDPPQALTPNAA